jgi:UrcA family protein
MNLSSIERRKLIGFALSCAVALSVGDAFAAPGDFSGVSVDVKYSKSELERHDGVESLYRRIRIAAQMVCEEPDMRDLARRNVYRKCYTTAVDAAVAKVGDARLTVRHRSSTYSKALFEIAAMQ